MMKTLQEEIAEEVVEELKKDPSIVGIEIAGSLARGDIGPDSDIDLGVISESAKQHRFIEEFRGETKVDKGIIPLNVLLESVETHPFLFYTSLLSKIVHDPKGIVRQVHDKLAIYFENHPEIVAFWDEKLLRKKAAKMKGEEQEGYRSVLDEAEMRFSKEKPITRKFFQR
ncbi:MAG: nucleotidyltransferase domain-containing protein [Candidatus Thorarchaeota archaeon]|jgi:predicted nucleotidyltransferase